VSAGHSVPDSVSAGQSSRLLAQPSMSASGGHALNGYRSSISPCIPVPRRSDGRRIMLRLAIVAGSNDVE
jgi:hypothetical protein